MVTLNLIFQALGYRSEEQQRHLIKLMEAAGVFGQLPGVDGTLSDQQAQAILAGVTFGDTTEAAHWLHDNTQKYMLRRPPGASDYQCEEPEHFRKNRGELLSALHSLGMLAEVKPQAKHYDHVLVLGSMEGVVSTRLDMVREFYDQGVRFDKIYLLGSERKLDPEREPLARVATDVGSVATEMQMMIARAYEKSETWPEGLQHSPFNAVSTAGRANTQDTIVTWLKTNPKPGRVLVISSQPNIAYQDAAVKSVLPPQFAVETVGARISEDGLKISVCMDDLARRIDVGFPKLLEALKHESHLYETPLIGVDPASVKVDATTYQFRSGGNRDGVTCKGRYDTDQWDPILHGDPILVHERLDGSLFVADGHHRLALAKRLNAQGNGPGNILALVLSENQGYTPQDVKLIAAYKNIAQMSRAGSDAAALTDAARAFKEAETLPFDHKKLLPTLKLEGNVKLSYTLSKLSEPALDMVTKGEVPAVMAARVVEYVPNDPHRQEEVIRIVSAKLHGNCASFAPAGHYEMRPQPASAEANIPGFLAKLQRQRASAAAGIQIG